MLSAPDPSAPVEISGGSRLAHAFWPAAYHALRWLEPLLDPIWGRVPLGNVVQLIVRGRRFGQPRRVYVGLLHAGGNWYLGHPDLPCEWTLNLEAAGGEIRYPDGRTWRFMAVPLEPGPERDAVIRSTFRQHPFPGTVLYWLGRNHLRAVGRFYRLEDSASEDA
ncbi:MAG: hypothetical protein ACJ761_01835 [Chloroflexota bacterium]